MPRVSPFHGVRAVLFDLVGTLTAAVSAHQRNAGHRLVATTLGVEPGAYLTALLDTYPERASGRHGSIEQTMRQVARYAGSHPTDGQVARACAMRRTVERRHLRFRPDAERVLATLGAAGIRTGVVSDCTHEVPTMWPSLPVAPHIDASVFSVEIGCCKPDPEVYATACQRLDVRPQECLYVGDGGSQELSGARNTGMFAVQLRAPDSDRHASYRPETGWRGPTVRTLSDVLPVVAALNDASAGWIPLPRTPSPDETSVVDAGTAVNIGR